MQQKLLNIFKEKRIDEFHRIKNTYKNFEKFLLTNGSLLSKDTKIGFWSATPLNDLISLFEVLGFDNATNFCDLGSGDGRITLTASLFNLKKVVGVEYDTWLYKAGIHMKNHINLDNFWKVKFYNEDFAKHNIRGYDFVYIHPDKPFYRGIEEKLKKEIENGKLIVYGYEFLPKTLKLLQTFTLNGERFSVFVNDNK